MVGNCGGLIVKDPSTELAFRHFHYLAKCFQVMCASDEFDFLPRAQRASQYYDQVDNLNTHYIERDPWYSDGWEPVSQIPIGRRRTAVSSD